MLNEKVMQEYEQTSSLQVISVQLGELKETTKTGFGRLETKFDSYDLRLRTVEMELSALEADYKASARNTRWLIGIGMASATVLISLVQVVMR